jgi:hypothetical protein
MQNQVLTRAFRISEMLKVYDAPIGQAQEIHGTADYHLDDEQTRIPANF